jgi:hypothetical protein
VLARDAGNRAEKNISGQVAAQQLAVAIDVIEIPHQNNFEEHYWVYTFISL